MKRQKKAAHTPPVPSPPDVRVTTFSTNTCLFRWRRCHWAVSQPWCLQRCWWVWKINLLLDLVGQRQQRQGMWSMWMRVVRKSEKVLQSSAHPMCAVLRQSDVQGEDSLKEHLSPKGDECCDHQEDKLCLQRLTLPGNPVSLTTLKVFPSTSFTQADAWGIDRPESCRKGVLQRLIELPQTDFVFSWSLLGDCWAHHMLFCGLKVVASTRWELSYPPTGQTNIWKAHFGLHCLWFFFQPGPWSQQGQVGSHQARGPRKHKW